MQIGCLVIIYVCTLAVISLSTERNFNDCIVNFISPTDAMRQQLPWSIWDNLSVHELTLSAAIFRFCQNLKWRWVMEKLLKIYTYLLSIGYMCFLFISNTSLHYIRWYSKHRLCLAEGFCSVNSVLFLYRFLRVNLVSITSMFEYSRL